MPQREIRVDLEGLGALASSLHQAHDMLEASPNFAYLEAGDVRGRLPDAVSDFITKNNGPREELIQQLDQAWQVIDQAYEGFFETESSLVRALGGGESR